MACAASYSRCVHITFKAISWAYSSSVPSYGPLPHVQLIGIFEHVAQWHMVPGPNMWARVNLASWTVSFESMMMRRLGPIQAESVSVQPLYWIPACIIINYVCTWSLILVMILACSFSSVHNSILNYLQIKILSRICVDNNILRPEIYKSWGRKGIQVCPYQNSVLHQEV